MDNNLPKKIWFLWLQGLDDAPFVVKKCHESWIRHNPDWELILLDEKSIEQYLDHIPLYITQQALSDILRINLLAKHGGVWVDATCFCMKPLNDWLFNHMQSGFFAFSKPMPTRMIASWFLAGNKYNYIINKFCNSVNAYWSNNPGMQFIEISKFASFNRRLSKMDNRIWFGIFITKILKVYPYFWMHFLFAYIYFRDRNFKEMWDSSSSFPAKDPHIILFSILENPMSDEIKSHIDNKLSPVYKLTWKHDSDAVYKPGTALNYLFALQENHA